MKEQKSSMAYTNDCNVSFKGTDNDMHILVVAAATAFFKMRELLIPVIVDEDFTNRLLLKKALHDARFFLYALELRTRNVSDDMYRSESFQRECDEYGM